MHTALLSKNKLQFVIGHISMPSKDDPLYTAWVHCNTLVLSWLHHSVSPSIAQSIIWIDQATKSVDWYERSILPRTYFRIADIQEEIHAFHQGTFNITDYFTQLKIICHELLVLRPFPVCTCSVPFWSNALTIVKDYCQSDYIIWFLKGLNDYFSIVRSQIMLLDPIPYINKVFGMVLQQERQLSLRTSASIHSSLEPTVFIASGNNIKETNHHLYLLW